MGRNKKISSTYNFKSFLTKAVPIQRLKMMINANFGQDFEQFFEPRLKIIPSRITGFPGKNNQTFKNFRSEIVSIDKENGTWEQSFDLDMLPTKAEDLKVKIVEGNLIISGVSEVENERNGFSLKSKHEWTREIQIPQFVEDEKIKVKMTQNNLIKITGSGKDHSTEIMIEN